MTRTAAALAAALWTTLVLGVVLESGNAQAQTTGNQLHRVCQSDGFTDKGFCKGYIVGVIDMLTDTYRTYCTPEGVTYEQSVDIVTAFVRTNPADRHLPAWILINVALARNYPCE